MSDQEEWRPIAGFEGLYEVSNLGRVRSLDRTIRAVSRTGTPFERTFKGVILRACENKKRHGYRQVNLHANGSQTQRRVCVLVAGAFIGPRPEGYVTMHLNGIVTDDRASNLKYGTPKENTADMVRHGTKLFGEKCPQSRLTEADARYIKYGGERPEVLAERYGIHPGHVNNIRRGVRWKHV